MIKTFGCSYTKYRWNTWSDFLKLSCTGKLQNFGIPGASNEIICRNICKNAEIGDTIVVMWSGFDRVHSDIFYKKNHTCEGRYDSIVRNQNFILSLEQLYDRTVEYIYLANKFCENKNIKIFNFLITIFELGETKELQKFKPYLQIDHKKWPIDMNSFCLENNVIGKTTKDPHPSPSQHYKYCQQIICKTMNIKPYEISVEKLEKLDNQREDREANGQ